MTANNFQDMNDKPGILAVAMQDVPNLETDFTSWKDSSLLFMSTINWVVRTRESQNIRDKLKRLIIFEFCDNLTHHMDGSVLSEIIIELEDDESL